MKSLRLLALPVRIYAFNNLHPNSRVAFDEIMDLCSQQTGSFV